MSLLNEALRKNRSEKMQRVIFHAPSQGAHNPRRILFFIILLLAASTGFAYMWTMDDSDISAPPAIRAESRVADNSVIPVAETVKTSLAAEKEVIKEPAIEVSEVKDMPRHIPEQVNSPKVETRDKPEKDIVKREIAKEEKAAEIVILESEENADAFMKKAIQLHRVGKYENALIMYKKVLGLDSANSEARFNMASIYITMNRYQEAYSILSALASSDRHDPETMLNLAVSEIGLMKYDDALNHLQAIDGDNPELLFEISFNRGVALSRIGKPDDAIVSYMTAEKINSNHPGLLLNMAVLYDRYGKYKEAIHYYTKIIESGYPGPAEMDKYKNRIETLSSYLPAAPVKGSSNN